jgi:hypothetical protein
MTKNRYSRSPPPPNNSSNQSNSSSNQSSGFFGNMIQGMALGTGSSIGHKVVDGVFNERKEEKYYYNKEEKTNDNKKEEIYDCKNSADIHYIKFNNCMKETDNNYIICESILNSYFECLKNKSQNKF